MSRAAAIAFFQSIDEAISKVVEDVNRNARFDDVRDQLDLLIKKGRAAHERIPLRSPPEWDRMAVALATDPRRNFADSLKHYARVTKQIVSLLRDEENWSVSGIETESEEAETTSELVTAVRRLLSGYTYSLDNVITQVWAQGKPAGLASPLAAYAATVPNLATCISELWTGEERQGQRLVPYADALVAIVRSTEHFVRALIEGVTASTDWAPTWLDLVAQFRERYNACLGMLDTHFAKVLSSRAPSFDRLDDVQTLRFGSTGPLLAQGTFGPNEKYSATEAVRQIIKTATTEVMLVDNYASGDTISLLFASPVAVTARVLTQTMYPDYAVMATRFRQDRGQAAIETRQSNTVHDRYLVIDNSTYYHLGASIKDLGGKLFSFSRKDDAAEIGRIQSALSTIWNAATVVP